MSLEMDPEVAKNLLTEGATLVFLDVPKNTEVGIDMNSWTVGEKFKGIKMIPPGIHFIYYSAVSKEGQVAPRTGFFHVFRRKELLVKNYDPHLEDIPPEPPHPNLVQRLKDNLKELDCFLGPFPYDSWKKWISLTGHISEDLIKNQEPICGKISSAPNLIPFTNEERKQLQRDWIPPDFSNRGPGWEEKLLPQMKKVPGMEMRFTPLPEKRYPQGSTPAEITKHCMDSSFCLDKMLENHRIPEDLLGEFQLAFVCFLVGYVYEAFEHWKQLIQLFTTCDEALKTRPEFFLQFISTLHFQMKEVPSDFFTDIVAGKNFLRDCLHTFFANINATGDVLDAKLRTRAQKFREHVEATFEWEFSEEGEEDLPVIVEDVT
ncbi:unnamed protein product [Darwinula stevensoni]|uniref:Protein AAR2 homolog n=1 Tax=Darwinula stevensoni TaxID=69355 RepID=A0A7R8XEF6_9CRUS|nr:unnamed protein product [Darwinula stevensoni]CAG0887788.1 unnamed protein product [Darwinula stevensoni]